MNLQNLQEFAEQFNTIACIISIESTEDGGYENIRLETGNQAYLHSFPPQVHFIPGQIYTNYIPKDLNFEHFVYNAAIRKKPMHAYVYSDNFGAWFNIYSLPIVSDEPHKHYCVYTQEMDAAPNAELLAKHSARITNEVLKICIKLRDQKSFQESMDSIIADIRKMCKAEQCCLMLTDFKNKSVHLQSECIDPGSNLMSFKNYLTQDFIVRAQSWLDAIGGSNCIIVQNEQDMEHVRARNSKWYDSLKEAHIQTVALFPLKNKNETIGFIWASNFDTKNTDFIKETLELTAFFIASEVANHKLVGRLAELSENDLLTEVKNRNAMNNWVTAYVEGRTSPSKSVGVIFMDLNGLKAVNDNEGHAAGDNLLKDAANVLKSIFQKGDIYRAGGDEFLVIVLDETKQALEACIQKLHATAYNPHKVHFAVGFYYSENGCDIRDAMKQADALMYEDKKRYYAEHPELKHR